ncbi:MAG TPA: helix-turn-helix transcriptional regulator [Dysgonamonadaceae bacterium]|mgnify:CR=1 FL=1|jgi:transcriptional regulator with XRE-family HTH domain|nr:helix-turn-helix transcriptional regulator [Weeksellaceae bacterium]HOV72123.1 helix-turn-helix transcriptional regulator [Dysgonamonadaceae bacterium]
MKTNREKFNIIATSTDTEILNEIAYRKANRDWLRKSNRIAAKVLAALKEQNMSQKDLADKMNVSPQYVNKIVKGNENLTLATITKLENLLHIIILADTEKEIYSVSEPLISYEADVKEPSYITESYYGDAV